MTTILHIKSSSNLKGSYSRQLGSVVIEQLKNQHPGAKIIERDLVAEPVPHVSPEFVDARMAGNGKALALSDHLIDEVLASDILVIESPMYNFNIPSVLKAWIDHIARAGKTFRYTASGPEPLLRNKRAILALASGGIYSQGPAKPFDFQETYLRAILGFIGITDVETIRVEGVGLGPDKAAEALANAKQRALALTARAA